MGWLEGLLTGYADRHYDIAKQKRAEAELAAQREAQVYQALLNSEYPDIRDRAGAGILDLANPRRRKGGIAGWMGEMEQSPYLDAVRRARERIETDPAYADQQLGRTTPESGGRPPVTPSIPSSAGSVPPPAPGTPPGALPPDSLTTGGQGNQPTPAPPTPPVTTYMDQLQYSGPGGTDWYGNAPPMPGNMVPTEPVMPGGPRIPGAPVGGVGVAAPQGPPAAQGAPPAAAAAPAQAGVPGAPPMPPAGPPIPLAGATDPRLQADLGQVAAGLPGATTRPLGPPPTLPRGRTDLSRPRPGIFPTTADTHRQQSRAAVSGKIDAYAEMYRAQGYDDQTAYAKAAELFERDLVSGTGMPFSNTRGEYTDPATGQVVRTPVVFDRSTGRYTLPDGRPAPADMRIVATGRLSQAQEAAAIKLGYPSATAVPQHLVPEMLAMAREIEAENITSKPASAIASAGLAARLADKWTRTQAPIQKMEVSLRTMSDAYKAYKAGDASAWETLRTSFVQISEPNSIVMPGEFQRAADVLSWQNRIKAYLDRAQHGGGAVTMQEVDEMARLADTIWQTMATFGSQTKAQLEAQIRDPRLGVSHEEVFGDAPRYQPDWGTGAGAGTGTGATPAVTPNPSIPQRGFYRDPVTGKRYLDGKEY